ncbi:hypothetical protein Cgig2_024597 [Carnegiea gigantea]|uniref:Uncharacterized protein n=1 Tax=Carnegiea gigantea TaxID=171969 RepID=A0A9Q1QJX1_9CARY|nr:hypothetical protein Cgig2_024597 [Carnegiea gigantea]
MWNNSKRSGELRRIIGDKEVIDMVAKLGKCKSVHVYAIDEHVKSLTLPHVTYRFVDTSRVQNQKEKAQLSTINGGNGSMANAGKRLVNPRFLPPGSLCRGRVQSLKTSGRPILMEAQTQREQSPIKEAQVDQTPIEAFEAGPHAEVASKENLVPEEHGAHDDQQQHLLLREFESRLNNIKHLETDHQKKIDDMQAAHKKDIEELQGEIKSIIFRYLIIGVADRGTIVDSLTEEELAVVSSVDDVWILSGTQRLVVFVVGIDLYGTARPFLGK